MTAAEAAHFVDYCDQFFDDVSDELTFALKKYPMPNPTLAAMTEEVGELAKALLQIREGKSTDWTHVRDEAVQVAAMALRLAYEGDVTIGALSPFYRGEQP